jgi:hypothetical protein
MSSVSISKEELNARIQDLNSRVKAAHRWGRDEKHNMTYTIYSDGEISYEGHGWSRGCDGIQSYAIDGAKELGLEFAYEMRDRFGNPFTAACLTLENATNFVREIRELIELKTGKQHVVTPTLMQAVLGE